MILPAWNDDPLRAWAGAALHAVKHEGYDAFWHTLQRMKTPVIVIALVLGLGFLTRYSGTDAVLGLAFTGAGYFYPFFAAYLGWLGVFLTGSDTASNALFGSLQVITATSLNLPPVLMAAANSAGGVMGKMVAAQSLVVAAAAVGEHGREGDLFRKILPHSLVLAGIVGLIVMFFATLGRVWVP